MRSVFAFEGPEDLRFAAGRHARDRERRGHERGDDRDGLEHGEPWPVLQGLERENRRLVARDVDAHRREDRAHSPGVGRTFVAERVDV